MDYSLKIQFFHFFFIEIDESSNEHMSNTILNQNPAVDLDERKELNHGPDK